MAYNTYPAVDDTTKRFPPSVENALINSPTFTSKVQSLIPNIPDQGSTARVKVVTGLETRPNVDFVIWIGGASKPANMWEDDIWGNTDGVTPPSTPTIVTSSFNSMIVGTSFNQTLSATGVGPFTWSATGLPAGLTLSSSGVLSGTPTAAGSGTAVITCSNAGGPATRNIGWTVSASATAPVISSSPTPPAAQVGVAYAFSPGRTGSTPMTWGISVGALPPGLSINSSTGAISGTPTTAGSWSFTMQATNTVGNDTQGFSMTVANAPAATASIFNGVAPAEPISYSDAATGSWVSHMFYVPASGASLESAVISGARLYIPADSAHIGQTWRAALVRRTGAGVINGTSFGGQAQYDSNGSKTEGAVLVAGWNDITFGSTWNGVANQEAIMIGVQIGDGTRYVHVASGVSIAYIPMAGVNLVLAETEYRSWYRDDQFDSTLWYGIDIKIAV